MSEPARAGYRGYIGSRPVLGNRAPQAVQNLVVRDYCQRSGLQYLLSSVEYAMPRCYMMLNEVLAELPRLQGIVCYTLFMLPEAADRRREVYRRVLAAKATLHTAIEGQVLRTAEDIGRIEDIWLVQQALARAPKTL
ncbi:MAG: sporadic carbohydrate cluster protein, TIGR04323 family [Alphaproteobacteria bacterium]|nr:sporadic carbohydrate cluster protein, TIGR04323 family [Alphaproteobacteria bacterium]